MNLSKSLIPSFRLTAPSWALASLVALLMTFGSAVHAAPPAAAATPATANQTVNVNQADAEQLARVLVGVGSQKAEAIIAYRTENGPFSSLEQLLEVNGIGPATLERNREQIKL